MSFNDQSTPVMPAGSHSRTGLLALLIAGLMLCAPRPLAAQPEKILAVRFQAAPEVERRLLRYVEIRPGDTWDAEAVRHAVVLLHSTGAFEDIRVEKHTLSDGIELVFCPAPAPFLTSVTVEGDRVLSVRQAQGIAKLREGDALWSYRLEQAGRDIQGTLIERGYAQAQVNAEVRRLPEGAVAVFRIQAGARAFIRRIAFQGSPTLRLRNRIHLGAPFSQTRADKERLRLTESLRKAGHWRAAITLESRIDPTHTAVELIYSVAAGRRTRIVFAGQAAPGSLRKIVLRLLRDGSLGTDVMEEARERLEEWLRRQGRRQASVTYTTATRDNEEIVTFTLAASPPARIARIQIHGAPDSPLPVASAITARIHGRLDEDQIQRDARAIKAALEAQGYTHPQVETEIGEGLEPDVSFDLSPGTRTLLRSFDVSLPATLRLETPKLATGGAYRPVQIARARDELLRGLHSAGYLQAEVLPQAVFADDSRAASITLKVNPGPQTRIEHVILSGLTFTREEVLRREFSFKEGEALNPDAVIESQRRLALLGLFRQVSIGELNPESPESRILVVKIDEAPRTNWTLGLGAAGMCTGSCSGLSAGENAVLRMSAEVTRKNLAGLDRSLSAFARFSFRGSRLMGSYREPYLFGRKADLSITTFREEEDREYFYFDRLGATLETTRSLPRHWNAILRYVISKTTSNVHDQGQEIDRQYRNSRFSGPSLSLVRDTRDDPLDPHRGLFVSGDLAFSHAALGGSSFIKSFFQTSTFLRVAPTLVLATGGRVGLAWTFRGQTLADPDRFYAGGQYSIRGFDVDGVRPAGGQGLIIANAELRHSLTSRLSLAAFGDAGNVYATVRDMRALRPRYVAGLGLRYRSALGPLRADWGYRLNAGEIDQPQRRYSFHLTIGHAF
ncbi:MAG: BamA/TamA family outer membrane protein [Vicinamibacteria bacterium]|nr:BamA/TamA family outer membrane protein [Vicinamibacteria bacterium]